MFTYSHRWCVHVECRHCMASSTLTPNHTVCQQNLTPALLWYVFYLLIGCHLSSNQTGCLVDMVEKDLTERCIFEDLQMLFLSRFYYFFQLIVLITYFVVVILIITFSLLVNYFLKRSVLNLFKDPSETITQ